MHAAIPSNKGFTLVEVLAAMAIIAFGLGALWKVLSQEIVVSQALPDRIIARWVAHNRIVTRQAHAQWPATRVYKGSEIMAGREWYWEEQVSATDEPLLRRVTVKVGNDPDSLSLFTLEGYVQRPRPPAKLPGIIYDLKDEEGLGQGLSRGRG